MRSKPTITVVLLVAAALVGCGGGKNSTSSSSSTADTGVNGTYTGTFTPSNPAFPPFQVTAQLQQAALADSLTGTATVQNAPCLNGITLNVTGAEVTGGALSISMVDGDPSNSTLPNIAFKGNDVSNHQDATFSGTFEIPGPRGSCPEVKGAASLAR